MNKDGSVITITRSPDQYEEEYEEYNITNGNEKIEDHEGAIEVFDDIFDSKQKTSDPCFTRDVIKIQILNIYTSLKIFPGKTKLKITVTWLFFEQNLGDMENL